MGAEKGRQGLRDGAGEEEGRPGPLVFQMVVEPLLSCMLLTLGTVSVFGALAAVDMDLAALAIDVGDLRGEGFMEPEAHARDGGAGDLVVQGCGGRKEPPDLLHTEDGGETVGSVRAPERQRVPVALENVLREEAHTAGAETHGRWSEAIDVCAVEEVSLEFLFRDAVG